MQGEDVVSICAEECDTSQLLSPDYTSPEESSAGNSPLNAVEVENLEESVVILDDEDKNDGNVV